MRIRTLLALPGLAAGLGLLGSAVAQEAAPAADWRQQAEAALARGAAFMVAKQEASGNWGQTNQPAIAALGAVALHQCPGADPATAQGATAKAIACVAGYAQPDGSIYDAQARRGGYPNYNTAICLLALATVADEQHLPLVRAARGYLMASQVDAPEKPQHGGFSYAQGPQGGRPDLSNASWVAEAMYYSEALVRDRPDTPKEDAERSAAMWQKLRTFLDKSQKLSAADHADLDAAGTDVGGFAYLPNDDVNKLVTTGSMTYAGLKTMIYARLKPDDIRVKGVLHYARNHYTLDENPGSGMNGYYYYVLMFAKALQVSGVHEIVTADGGRHDWRRDLVAKLAARQQADGSWANAEGRFMESMPELVTSYAMLALRAALAEPAAAK